MGLCQAPNRLLKDQSMLPCQAMLQSSGTEVHLAILQSLDEMQVTCVCVAIQADRFNRLGRTSAIHNSCTSLQG